MASGQEDGAACSRHARTVLIHLALDEGKRRSRRRSELGPEATGLLEAHHDDAAVRILGRVETSSDLLGVLRELPPRQRAALVLRYFDDLSVVCQSHGTS